MSNVVFSWASLNAAEIPAYEGIALSSVTLVVEGRNVLIGW